MKQALFTLILLLSATNIVIAGDFDDGVKAYDHKDYATAFTLFKRAAEQGSTRAQYNLGLMYSYGQAVAQDYQQAVVWFRKAAEAGDIGAQQNLGLMYYGGTGVPQDFVLAHMWANLAAIKNNNYVKTRDAIARNMTPSQIAEAQRLAREWKPKAK